MTVREDLCTLPAVLHGGAFMALADTGWSGDLARRVTVMPMGYGSKFARSKDMVNAVNSTALAGLRTRQ